LLALLPGLLHALVSSRRKQRKFVPHAHSEAKRIRTRRMAFSFCAACNWDCRRRINPSCSFCTFCSGMRHLERSSQRKRKIPRCHLHGASLFLAVPLSSE
jgi:hypothetical protein